jgi:hypothetical protein
MVLGGDGGHVDGVGPPGAASRVSNIHLAQDGGMPVRSYPKSRVVDPAFSIIADPDTDPDPVPNLGF